MQIKENKALHELYDPKQIIIMRSILEALSSFNIPFRKLHLENTLSTVWCYCADFVQLKKLKY